MFAPTDRAFDKLPDGTVPALLADIPTLTSILTYHVIADTIVTSDELQAGDVPTLNGKPITVSFRRGKARLNGDITISTFDILASNGVIHVITDVLIPPSTTAPSPTITDIALAAPKFSILVQALVATGLDAALNDETASLTVFAPTNAAFRRLGMDTVDALLLDIPALTNILQYHVVPGTVLSTDLSDGSVTALNGDDIDVDVRHHYRRTNIFLNGNSKVVDADIIASNGVIHTINNVLIPPSKIPATAQANGLSTLFAALDAANLVTALEGVGPFTLFAPNNKAFSDLGEDTLNSLLADPDTLSNILLYHVVAGDNRPRDLLEVDSVTTLQNDAIHVSSHCTRRHGKRRCFLTLNDDVDFKKFNIEASNGVIHIIDKVLIPP